MHKKRSSPMWDFLDASGVLEKGNEDEIKAVKRLYRKKYLTEFKRSRRKSNPEFNVRFSKSNGEYQQIVDAGRRHNVSVSTFVKSAALAYLNKTYIVPNRLMVANLEQLLSDCFNQIKSITTKKERFWEREQTLERIEKVILQLEKQMNILFRDPVLYTHDHQNQIP